MDGTVAGLQSGLVNPTSVAYASQTARSAVWGGRGRDLWGLLQYNCASRVSHGLGRQWLCALHDCVLFTILWLEGS